MLTRNNDEVTFSLQSLVPPVGVSGFEASPNKICRSGVGGWIWAGFPEGDTFREGRFAVQLAWESVSQSEDAGFSIVKPENTNQRAHFSIAHGRAYNPRTTVWVDLPEPTAGVAHMFYLHVANNVATLYQRDAEVLSVTFDAPWWFDQGDGDAFALGFKFCEHYEYGVSGKYIYADKMRYRDVYYDV